MLSPILSALLAVQAAQAETVPASNEQQTESTQAGAVQVEKAESDDDDAIICRRTMITGTKFKKKLCATQSQWEALTRRSRDTTRELQKKGKGLEPVR